MAGLFIINAIIATEDTQLTIYEPFERTTGRLIPKLISRQDKWQKWVAPKVLGEDVSITTLLSCSFTTMPARRGARNVAPLDRKKKCQAY